MTDPRVPARVDQAALERILQRAAELQAAEHDIGEGLTPEDVLSLGKEVGIPAQYLRQAMLEDEALKERAVHQGETELLRHSLCHGLTTTLGLTGDVSPGSRGWTLSPFLLIPLSRAASIP